MNPATPVMRYLAIDSHDKGGRGKQLISEVLKRRCCKTNCSRLVSNNSVRWFLIFMMWLLLLPIASWARIPVPEGTEDIAYLAQSASFIFHAQVVEIEPNDQQTQWRQAGIATLAVDRWYKGAPQPPIVRIRFAYDDNSAINGHDCVDLRRSSTWLIFANQTTTDLFEFSHDCEGGLPMAPIAGPSTSEAWLQQLQQDLIAGLSDNNPVMRLANIARLGGLKLPSSTAALHKFVEHGTEAESKWAIYAALRSGDLGVLPRVETIAIDLEKPATAHDLHSPLVAEDAAPVSHSAYGDPESDIVFELRHLRDRRAVPLLIKILDLAKTGLARECAVQALQEIKDPRAIPSVARHLDDSDRYVRYDSLVTIMYVTHVPECTLANDWKEWEIPTYVDHCKNWWNVSGRKRHWFDFGFQ